MKWFIIGLIVLGIALIYIGNSETNNMSQSADVRVGGSIFIIIGIICIVLAFIVAFGLFLWGI